MVGFQELLTRYIWTPITGCPGRFVCHGAIDTLAMCELTGRDGQYFRSEKCRDEVWVQAIPGGGVISYRKPDGSWVHTLCDESGFERKLKQLEIAHT